MLAITFKYGQAAIGEKSDMVSCLENLVPVPTSTDDSPDVQRQSMNVASTPAVEVIILDGAAIS